MKKVVLILIIVAAGIGFVLYYRKSSAKTPVTSNDDGTKSVSPAEKIFALTGTLQDLATEIASGNATDETIAKHVAATNAKIKELQSQAAVHDKVLDEVVAGRNDGSIPDQAGIQAQQLIAESKAGILQDALTTLQQSVAIVGPSQEVMQTIAEVKSELVHEIQNAITASTPPQVYEEPTAVIQSASSDQYWWENQSTADLVDQGYSDTAILNMNRKANLV